MMKRFILILALTGIINSANSMDCWQAMSLGVYNAHGIYIDNLVDCMKDNVLNLVGGDPIGAIDNIDCAENARSDYNTTVDDICNLFFACIGQG